MSLAILLVFIYFSAPSLSLHLKYASIMRAASELVFISNWSEYVLNSDQRI